MTIALYPKQEQLETLLAGPADSPVVMLNLLRFKEHATAPDEGVSGEEAYQRYGDAMRKLVEIATSPEVAAIGVHRAGGLEGQWLLATSARPQ